MSHHEKPVTFRKTNKTEVSLQVRSHDPLIFNSCNKIQTSNGVSFANAVVASRYVCVWRAKRMCINNCQMHSPQISMLANGNIICTHS